jgi:bifunctional NMN adenylyltransferase/nudix hydrolase
VQRIVADQVEHSFGWSDYPRKGGIIGHEKDESSFYLKLFPQWEIVDHNMNEVVHATDIRKLYFESNIKYLSSVIPAPVFEFLQSFKNRDEYQVLLEEWEFIKKYKKSWEAAPYAPTFLTCDAVVVQSGFVLLIERKAAPGKGLWGLPGGFVNQHERIQDAMLRELREETRIKVPSKVLAGCIEGTAVFDDPNRSLRGRTITQAFYIKLPPGDLPQVKGADDAKQATWVPLSQIKEEEMFEDHLTIIQHFVGYFNIR